MKTIWTGVLWTGMCGMTLNGFDIRDVSPITGSAQDTTITIRGQGFDPDQTYSVTVDGHAALVRSVTADQITADLVSTTTSGLIVVSDGTDERLALEPFTVTRILQGVFQPPNGISAVGYKILAYQSLVDPVLNEGSGTYEFSVEVPLVEPTFLWAVRSEQDPVFVGVVDSSDDKALVDVASTAIGLAFMNPALMAREDEIVQTYKSLIQEKDLAAEMKAYLTREMQEGESFLFHPEYQRLMGELIASLINERSASSSAAKQALPPSVTPPPNTLIHPLNKEFVFSEITTKLSLTPPFYLHPDDYTLKIEVGSRFSSLDWIIEVFRLRNGAFDFEEGREDVLKLTWEDTPTLASTRPVGEAFLAAKLDTARVDYIGRLVDWVIELAIDSVFTESTELGPNEIALSAGKPDIYLVQAYSGNVFWRYGGQEYVLDDFDPNHGWLISLSNNSIILVVDFASMFIDFKKLTGVDDLGFITSQYKSLQKAFSVALVDGELSKGEFLGLIGTSIKSVVSGALSKIIDVALEKGVFITFARTMGNVIWSSLDVFKKISSGLQIIERAGGLLLPGRLAVERSIVVIRNPFQPVVRSITRQARKNETVTIQGRNFPFFSDPVVSFCTFSEDDAVEEGDPLKSLVAEILSKNSQTIIIKVPENFGEIFRLFGRICG